LQIVPQARQGQAIDSSKLVKLPPPRCTSNPSWLMLSSTQMAELEPFLTRRVTGVAVPGEQLHA
jgi:hypothetical protein